MNQTMCMQELSIFSDLDFLEKQKVARLAQQKILKPEEILFHQGEEADAIYLIKAGAIKLFKVSENGKEVIMDILHADDVYGEAHLFEEAEQPFTAQAMEESFVCYCSKKEFQKLITENPTVAFKVVETLGKKLSQYTQQMASMAFEDVKGRLLRILVQLAENYGAETSQGIRIDLSLTHQELASLVNASRVMVTNTLKELKHQGLIDYHNRHYYLKEKSELANFI